MRSHELTTGRTFGTAFDHGDDFFDTLTAFCTANNVRQGYIPMFIAGFAEAEIVGTCEKLADPGAPVWSKVHLTNVEALGYDPETDRVLPHIHTSVGLKERSALGHTSHLLSARVQFLVEMLLVEITMPVMIRTREPTLYDVPLLRFGSWQPWKIARLRQPLRVAQEAGWLHSMGAGYRPLVACRAGHLHTDDSVAFYRTAVREPAIATVVAKMM